MGTTETWKPVPGYEGRYEVSDAGCVRTLRTDPPRAIHHNTHPNGYIQVRLYRAGVGATLKVHRLVLQAFIGDEAGRPCVNHIDHDKANNRLENLEWCTHAENSKAGYDAGKINPPSFIGADHPRAQLNESKVRVIRRARDMGVPARFLGDCFGVSRFVVWEACRASWKHVQHGGPLA